MRSCAYSSRRRHSHLRRGSGDRSRARVVCGTLPRGDREQSPTAFEYATLRDAAASARVSFLFEGAVMAASRSSISCARPCPPSRFSASRRGNSTRTTSFGPRGRRRVHPALLRMQADGIAEADRRWIWRVGLGCQGRGARQRLMDARITPAAVERTGIGKWSGDAARHAIVRGGGFAWWLPRRGAATGRSGRPWRRSNCRQRPAGRLRGHSNALIFRTDCSARLRFASSKQPDAHRIRAAERSDHDSKARRP